MHGKLVVFANFAPKCELLFDTPYIIQIYVLTYPNRVTFAYGFQFSKRVVGAELKHRHKYSLMIMRIENIYRLQYIHISYPKQGFQNARIFPGRRRNCVGEGSVSIAYMQSFHKFIVSLFCPIPPPMRAAVCKLLVEALILSGVI